MATDLASADPLMTTVESAPPVPFATPEPIVDHGDPEIAGETARETNGVGTDGEINIWEGRYCMRNFLGRLVFWGVMALLWSTLAIYTWAYHHEDLTIVAFATGLIVGFGWLALGRRMLLARFGHYYRLTNRRIFVSTGVFDRRRDQMELLRVEDVFTKQSLAQRWLSIGTVTIVSKEPAFPVLYLAGVSDPKAVMDLVWHHARAERDRRTVKVDQV